MTSLLRKRWVRIALPVIGALVAAVGAFAYYTSHGSDAATASVGTLSAPGQPTRSGPGNRVDLAWTASAGGPGTIAYHVQRSTSPVTTWNNACGTSVSSGTTSTSCTDAPGNGTFVYRVTALYHSWTKTGPQSDPFAVDATAPVVSSINRADSTPSNTASVHWSVAFSKSVTGVDSSDFALAGAGASGASISGVSGSGSSYTVTVATGADGALGLNLVDDDSISDSASNKLGGTGTGNGNFTGQTYTIDRSNPTGGALTVNGTSASGAGTSSFSGAASFTIGSITDYTDSGSGLASSTLVREQAPLSSSDGTTAGTCGTTWTGATTITSRAVPITQSLTGPTCYRYTLTGTDNAGNSTSVSTSVKVDQTTPNAPVVTPSAATGNTFVSGSTVYTNPQAGKAGGFTVSATTSDADSGILKVGFPSATGFTSGGGDDTSSPYSTTYAWSGAAATASGSQTVTAFNNASLTSTGSFTITPDTTAPSGGSVDATGLGGTGGRYSTSTTLSIALAKGTDTGSGLATSGAQLLRASATLGAGTCGAYGAFSQVGSNDPGTPYTDDAAGGIASGNCYKYQYLVPDNVGNVVTYTSGDIKVDTSAPTFLITEGAATLYTDGSTVVYFKGPNGTTFTITASDPESAVTSATFGSTTDTKWTKSTTSTSATWALNGANTDSTIGSSSATSNAGATGTLSSVSLIFDNTAPVNSLALASSPAAVGAFMSGTTIFYKSNAAGSFVLVDTVTDTESGAVSATFPIINTTGWTFNGGVAQTVSTPAGGPFASSAYSWTASPSVPSNKNVTSVDNVGTGSGNTAVSFVADAAGPTAAITFPTATSYNAAGWTGAISGSATDAASGVARVRVSVKDTTSGACADQSGAFTVAGCTSNFVNATGTGAWSFTLGVASLTDGHSYTVTAETTDNVGNTNSAADSTTWSYDTSAANATITSPSNGVNYTSATWPANPPFKGTAADATSGVGAVAMSIRRSDTGQCLNALNANASWVVCPDVGATAKFIAVTGTTSWQSANETYNNIATGLPAATTTQLTMVVRTTDVAGNVNNAAASITFGITKP